ncbi:hypothetical protein F4859DRAFT_273872 [Xylaria cf. heliscus]|nr:hypothetical protein F4859DRAFT_273872 [Xylaria cf. heliscus]
MHSTVLPQLLPLPTYPQQRPGISLPTINLMTAAPNSQLPTICLSPSRALFPFALFVHLKHSNALRRTKRSACALGCLALSCLASYRLVLSCASHGHSLHSQIIADGIELRPQHPTQSLKPRPLTTAQSHNRTITLSLTLSLTLSPCRPVAHTAIQLLHHESHTTLAACYSKP